MSDPVAVLQKIEWEGQVGWGEVECCPCCKRPKEEGPNHEIGCELAAAIGSPVGPPRLGLNYTDGSRTHRNERKQDPRLTPQPREKR